jgi:hypothetical protein
LAFDLRGLFLEELVQGGGGRLQRGQQFGEPGGDFEFGLNRCGGLGLLPSYYIATTCS